MAIHVEDILLLALAQKGDRYVFGSEASPLDPDPDQFDCSELVEWSHRRAKVSPQVPDGAYNQWMHARRYGRMLSVGDGLRTRGALLWVGDGTGSGRSAITHVAISLGNGTTIEARGAKWGVGTWASTGRFNFAGKFPGVDYTSTRPSFRTLKLTSPLMRGTDVEWAQKVMRDHANQDIAVDGVFGSLTQSAVKNIERQFSKPVDGTVDPDIWNLLNKISKE